MNSHSTNRPLSKGENLTVWGTLSIATFATFAAITLGCLGAALDDHDAAKQPVTTAAPDAASEAASQPQTLRLCVKCVHYVKLLPERSRFAHRCAAPALGVNLVTGEPILPQCGSTQRLRAQIWRYGWGVAHD